MMSTHRLLTLLALAPAIAACPAAPAQEAAAAEIWAHEDSDLPLDPAVVYGRLDSGLRYAILPNRTPAATGALRLRFDVGSLMEADDQRGLAHMLEHMAFNGSQNVTEGEMVRMLERAGLEFGPDTNAYTSLDETVYMLDLPNVREDTLDTALSLLREVADRLLIEPEALDRERGVVLSELRVRNTYSQRYQDAAQAFLYAGARFPERSPIGTEEVLRNAPAERVRDLYEAYYRPDRALLVFVGDAPAEAIEARIAATFADWTSAAPDGGDPDLGEVRPRPLEAGLFIDPDMPTVVTLSASWPAAEYVDTAGARRERLVRNLGFAILSRRFQTIARAADAPFISAQAGYSRVFDTLESASVNIVAENGHWAEALAAGEQELRRALDHGFTQAELDEQIEGYRASLTAAAAGAATRRTPRLADSLIGSLGGDSVFTHPSTDLMRFEAIAESLTVAEVEAAFRDAWGHGEPALFLGAPRAIEGGGEAVTAAFVDSRTVPVEQGAERERAAFAYEDLGAPGEVVSRAQVEDLDLTEVRFANNVRLNVKPTDFADDRVAVTVRVGAGRLELPADLPGLEFLADSTFVAGGLQAHSIDELQSMLAGRNVGLSFRTGDDAFVLSAVATPADLELQLKLFAAYLVAPGFREEARTRFLRSLEAWYESLDSTPIGVQSRDIPRLLRSGDPRYGIPDRDVVESRTLEELSEALSGALASGAVELAIVGDVDAETAIAATAASFGALSERAPASPPLEAARTLLFPDPTPEPITLRHAGEPDRALALVYWPGVDDSDIETLRALALTKDVLQLKLTERVREVDGASYSPSAFAAFSGVSPGYGYVGVSLDIEPELVDGYFATVDAIVAAMAAGEVSDDELTRAREPILADIEESLESNGYWADLAATAQSKPRYLESHRTRAAGYAAVTREDVTEMARRFLRADTAFRVAILPEPRGLAAASAPTGGQP